METNFEFIKRRLPTENQSKLARDSGVSYETIRNIVERRSRDSQVSNVDRLAKALREHFPETSQ